MLMGLVLVIGFIGLFAYLMKGMDEVKFNKAEYGHRTYVFCGVLVLLCLAIGEIRAIPLWSITWRDAIFRQCRERRKNMERW